MLDVAHEERSIELDAALGKFFPAANQLEKTCSTESGAMLQFFVFNFRPSSRWT